MLSNVVFLAFALAGARASPDVAVKNVDGNGNANVVELLRTLASQMTALNSRVKTLEALVQRLENALARQEATLVDQSREILKLRKNDMANVGHARELGDASRPSSPVQARNVINKYAFSAYLSHDVTGMSGNEQIVFDSTILNEGNAYNPQDGAFTALVGGVYLFSFVVNTYKDLPLWVKLVVNGNAMSHDVIWPHYNPSANMQGSNMVLLRLQRGDRVWVATEQDNAGTALHGGDNVRATTFSGVFLYE